ncbi:ATP-dependent Clp protease adapter ClpS [Jonesia quinghaiensis]|uniref:ATP-dependent Clp protease adapter ClpS n=1 Tax=Jonesia quinghaiensis TaxID=262806 RepID=UPI00040287AC|nr:ATP-dependent Clp protease adapter ClpS [Jonesia quinghaiensis]
MSVQPSESLVLDHEPATVPDSPWILLVWNDPVNLMNYVEWVFHSYFAYPREQAHRLMLAVHQDGKAVVATGSREKIEFDVQAMHNYGLWATMQRSEEG